MEGDEAREPADSVVENELRMQAQLHILTRHQERLEAMSLVVHRATCPVLACDHTYSDVDPLDVKRAQYVLNATDETT